MRRIECCPKEIGIKRQLTKEIFNIKVYKTQARPQPQHIQQTEHKTEINRWRREMEEEKTLKMKRRGVLSIKKSMNDRKFKNLFRLIKKHTHTCSMRVPQTYIDLTQPYTIHTKTISLSSTLREIFSISCEFVLCIYGIRSIPLPPPLSPSLDHSISDCSMNISANSKESMSAPWK